MLIDTHCHLDHPNLSARLEEVVENGRLAGVGAFVVPGVEPSGWDDVAALSLGSTAIYPAFGIHPLFANDFNDDTAARLELLLNNAVAVGEIGLDYSCKEVPRELQLKAFREQLRLSVVHGLPVILHCRRAFDDLLTIAKQEHVERVGGIMHAFSGSVEVAFQCMKLGLYISIAGTVTYLNAVKPLEVVRMVPIERLVLETDSPDLTPEPYRGSPNEPAFLVETAKKVAALKQLSLVEIASRTTGNAEKALRLHPTI